MNRRAGTPGRRGPGAGRRGYSLLGLLVAVTAVSFLLLPLFLSFQTSRTGATRSLHELTAVNLATAQIERLKRLSYRRLEALLFGIGSIEATQREDFEWPDVVNGPFEVTPETPDLDEPEAYREGPVVFHRKTFLSYFPDKNPDPNLPGFDRARRRMRIRVTVAWHEPHGPRATVPRSFELQTMVHDESYNPKPSLRRLATP